MVETLLLSKSGPIREEPVLLWFPPTQCQNSRPHSVKTHNSSEQIKFSRERMINSSEQIQFSRERMSVSALAVVEFSLAAAKSECADEIHARKNLKVARIDASSRVLALK